LTPHRGALTSGSHPRHDDGSMADFLAVLGIVGFVVAMLGLIWALDRV
jgi:hypothetical protein